MAAGVQLNWAENNTDETAVKVYRSTVPMTVGSLPSALISLTANSNSYLDETVASGTTYYYRVSSVKGLMEAVSAEVSVTTT